MRVILDDEIIDIIIGEEFDGLEYGGDEYIQWSSVKKKDSSNVINSYSVKQHMLLQVRMGITSYNDYEFSLYYRMFGLT